MEIVSFKVQGSILKRIDGLLRPLHFNNRTEFIREAIREKINKIEKDFWHKQVGTIPNTGNSVKEIRRIRKILSKQIKSAEDLEKINKEFLV
ncbi:ribbon-helix-helix domain-containing protein [Candidatus Woesearchaeota archaeon]|nr:ribbon-helix-helix domain-containing protein [Candidatus Woesearchaeota archaeon]